MNELLSLVLKILIANANNWKAEGASDKSGSQYHPNSVLSPPDPALGSHSDGLNPGESHGLNPNDLSGSLPEVMSAPTFPVFIKQPEDSFVMKSRPAVLECVVAHTTKTYFTCNGEAMAKSDKHVEKDLVDSSGAVVKNIHLTVTREQVEEYFGAFTCHCDSWSKRGQVSSEQAIVSIAYLNKEFEVPPYSQNTELGKQVEIRCHPPAGKPKPRIYWMKNKMEIQPERDSNFLQSADGHLMIIQIRQQDEGNYTCVAENVANRRVSPIAKLQIVVSGGWSSWSPWSDCVPRCGRGEQERHRVCNNPSPSGLVNFGGSKCPGVRTQKTDCTKICPVDGLWTSWSSWSTCSPDCLHHKRRTCSSPSPTNGGLYCRGKDLVASPCAGGMCRGKLLGDDPVRGNSRTNQETLVEMDVTLLIGLTVALVVFFSVTLVSIKLLRKKGRSQSLYNMASLDHHKEYPDKDGSKKVETNFSFPGARVCHKAEDKQILTNACYDFPSSATNSPFTDKRARSQVIQPMCDSLMNSPYTDKRAKSAVIQPMTATLVNSQPLLSQSLMKPISSHSGRQSPSHSEHQYDIPFSHLTQRDRASSQLKSAPEPEADKEQDYDDLQPVCHSSLSDSSSEEGGRQWQEQKMMEGPGLTPLLKHSAWIGSDKSLNTSLFSGSSRPASSCFDPELPSFRQSVSSSVMPPGLSPDSFTFATVTHTGIRLSLPEWGVSLLIPEGGLEKGFTEEVFLAVMREERDQPKLSTGQTLLSPVVLAGPPRVTFKKPVVLSFGHCASVQQGHWEIGVYHCDSMFSDSGDTSWVKLVTVGHESMSCPIYTQLDLDVCHILTDFLTRFCLVGQSQTEGRAIKVIKVLVFGQAFTSNLNYSVRVYAIDDTLDTIEGLLRAEEKHGGRLLDKPNPFYFQDGAKDLNVRIADLGEGWLMQHKKVHQTLPFASIWSGPSPPPACFSIEHSNPGHQILSFQLTIQQAEQRVTLNINSDLGRLVSPLSRSSNRSSLVASSSGCSSLPPNSSQRIPSHARQKLCAALDKEGRKGADWRALAVGLRLDRQSQFFSSRKSPTDCLLTLWEAQHRDSLALTDLLNLLRIIGRGDLAITLEKDLGPWV